jgi:hypothetical protein
MLRRLLFPTAALLALAASGCSKGLSNFEGAITLRTTRPGAAPADLVVKAKGDKLRFETRLSDGSAASAIYLPGQSRLVMINDAQKVAMDMDLSGPSSAPNTDPGTSDAEKTGSSETIAGLSCDDWKVKDPSGKRTEVCIAQGLAYFDLDAIRHGGGGAWSRSMRDKKMFPLRSVEYDASGKETSRTEAVSIEKTKLDDAIFDVPAGYQHMKAPAAH